MLFQTEPQKTRCKVDPSSSGKEMYIKTINIKRFRSILSEKFSLTALNIFIGDNDAGKSNIFKAINLFFNKQTDFNTDFNFDRDFCKSARVSKKSAKEISITIEFIIPKTFKEKRNIFWTKVWRKEGEVKSKEQMSYEGNKQIDKSRNRAIHWLEHIRFRYVPAVKSDHYFQELLGDLNDTLADSVERKIQTAATEFTKIIQESTDKISLELMQRLGMNSVLVLPKDLRRTFQTLDFNTKNSDLDISLSNRGDGIKTRHIPVILKFLAEQDDMTRTQGAPKISTIWGFEEPENNIELSKAFQLSKDFYEYSFSIQILITTHSPAFYGITRLRSVFPDFKEFVPERINVFNVTKDESDKISTVVRPIGDMSRLDQEFGMMPLIAPYVIEHIERANALEEEYSRLSTLLSAKEKPVVLTEGKTDPLILNAAYTKLYPNKVMPFIVHSCDTTPNLPEETAGAPMLRNALNAHRPDLQVTIGLFDHDGTGLKEFGSLNSNFVASEAVKFHKNRKAAALTIPKIPGLDDYFENENLCIEFLFPEEYLRKRHRGRGLVFRNKKITVRIESKKLSEMDSTEPYFREIVGGKALFAEKIVPTFPKEAFVGFLPLFQEIEKIVEELT